MRIVITFSQVIETIKNQQALYKTIASPLNNNRWWDYQLSLIAHPETYRGTPKKIPQGADRSLYFNPLTGEAIIREVKSQRAIGTGKKTTKKTSFTMPAPNGLVEFFPPRHGKNEFLGLIVDLRKKTDLKGERYFFPFVIESDKKPWLLRPGQSTKGLPRSIGLAGLQQMLKAVAENGEIPQCNEVMIGVSIESVIGIFTPKNTLLWRLNALARQQLIKKYLHIDVPILIITPEEGMQDYNLFSQQEDLLRVLNNRKKFKQAFAFMQAHIDASAELRERIAMPRTAMSLQVLAQRDLLLLTSKFLTLPEVAKLALISKEMRRISEQDRYWQAHEKNKIDTAIVYAGQREQCFVTEQIFDPEVKYLYREQQLKDGLKPRIIKTCQKQPELAVKIMHSERFSKQISAEQKQRHNPNILSRIIGMLVSGVAGLVLGTMYTLLYWLRSILAAGLLLPCFTEGFKTSSIRLFLGSTLFPGVALLGSTMLGLYNGWHNGLANFSNLFKAIGIMHRELFTGQDKSGSGNDPWSCCVCNEAGDAEPKIIKDSLEQIHADKTIASIAHDATRKKPRSLLFKSESVKTTEKSKLLVWQTDYSLMR